MGIGNWLTILAVLAMLGFILWTMPVGQRIANRLGLEGFRKEGAPKEDREFLLQACDGDRAKLQAMLKQARAGNPEMSDARAYRKAIRTFMRDKHGGNVA